jgi:hypothetical protein
VAAVECTCAPDICGETDGEGGMAGDLFRKDVLGETERECSRCAFVSCPLSSAIDNQI